MVGLVGCFFFSFGNAKRDRPAAGPGFARNSLECVLDSCGFPSLLLLLLSLLFFANLFAKFGCFIL